MRSVDTVGLSLTGGRENQVAVPVKYCKGCEGKSNGMRNQRKRLNYKAKVWRKAASTADMSGQTPITRPNLDSMIVVRLSVTITESTCNPDCRPASVVTEINTRLGWLALARIVVIIATIT